MKRKLVYVAVSLAFIVGAVASINVKKSPLIFDKVNNVVLADSQQEAITSATDLASQAINEKTFSKFSLAYAEAVKIYNAEVRDPLLWKLAGITLKQETVSLEQYQTVGQLSAIILNEALNEKTFYKYNLTYGLLMKINDASVRDPLLTKLSTIHDIVWTSDIKAHVASLDELTKTGSGKTYDKMDIDINKTNLSAIDKGYLLGELTGWGRNLVFTDDYKNAVNKVVYAGKMLNTGTDQNITAAIADAQTAVSSVKNMYSKSYLLEELANIKAQTEFSVVEIK
jgi:hypothetical protein